MTRGPRIAIAAAALVLVAGAGAALAQRDDEPADLPALLASSAEPEAEDQASADPSALDHAADRLADHGVEIDDGLLDELARSYGVGGAVRLAAWSEASGLSIDELRAMRDDGMGWGRIARELDLHPGIGSVMGRGDDHPGGGPPRTPDD
jgi:hypothetical protein